jgi:hypothetical protein
MNMRRITPVAVITLMLGLTAASICIYAQSSTSSQAATRPTKQLSSAETLALPSLIKPSDWITTSDFLQYHFIVTDLNGNILPWYRPDDLGASYDHMLHLVFEWWLNMERNPAEPNLPYYLMHQVWRPGPDYDPRGIGGDQVAMAMSSWRLFYDYTGDPRTIDNMILMANHVISNGLSASTDNWPNIPYPYNCIVLPDFPACTVTTLDEYDGDMILGLGYAQTDKAGSFGYELLNLYKITGDSQYLQVAINIADTLASQTQDGDADHSPLPYRVRTVDGYVNPSTGNPYTTNWTGLLMLWEGLMDLGQGNVSAYQTAHTKVLNWMKTYPLQNAADNTRPLGMGWGPFFEDGPGFSNTQINAVTFAMYVMEHRQTWGATWQQDARAALDWPIQRLGNNDWIQYGVQVINEQTGYPQPGNSHTSRQASMELRYAELTTDTTHVQNAIRQLSWATYMVDFDGKNYYLNTDIWLTDGYGDYIRHYLRAMAAAPYLAPNDQDHLLRTSSVIQNISYQTGQISYQTFDDHSQELLRVNTFVPVSVTADGVPLPRLNSVSELDQQEGYTLGASGDLPSVLRIRHDHARTIVISDNMPIPTSTPTPTATNTPTPTATNTLTPTPTSTPSPTPTKTLFLYYLPFIYKH